MDPVLSAEFAADCAAPNPVPMTIARRERCLVRLVSDRRVTYSKRVHVVTS
jgi:hypothetical protein